jgi:hypothetical protein
LAGCKSPVRAKSFRDASAVTSLGQGGWCWFQSPRAVIGPNDRLWYGSSVGGYGARAGDVEVTAVDLGSGRVAERQVLGRTRVDDHSSPSVLMVGGDRPQVAWSTHARSNWIEIGTAGGALQRITRPESMVSPGRGVSYASAHLVGGEHWMLYRGEQFSWNLLTSPDGRKWTARGLVVGPPPGGHRPYVVAYSDGTRLHLLATEGNPTEYRGTGVRYATIDADLTIRHNDGRYLGVVGRPSGIASWSQLYAGRIGSAEATDTDAWIADLAVIDYRPTAILSVRDPWPSTGHRVGKYRHRYLWARQRNSGEWTVEHLAWAGSELYAGQPDYTGLGALDASNPQRVVISTDVHPVTGVPLRSSADGRVHRELWEGYRPREGAWTWQALTANSAVDNLRPVIAAGHGQKALLWMRGTYRHWTDFDTSIALRRI